MLVSSRFGGAGAQWRQMSKLGKTAVISLSFVFLLGILWGTGTVDVDYVRNQFASIGENRGDEPIPTSKVETPIIDGVPNDENDRIPDEIIEGGTTKSSATTTETKTKTGTDNTSEKETEAEKAKEKPITTTVATPESQQAPSPRRRK
ncbi:hypothetical protein NPX13_g1942 [Xylaria arbuscula]|uniref:Uncharacterized protein n=1 Tax=Xylaria arbuscula TaxID=114810 RepID=A0A9W8NLH6_9PEZI|nr:hypothetical protein NPX13_g1942 [Xylaria arbuscula]